MSQTATDLDPLRPIEIVVRFLSLFFGAVLLLTLGAFVTNNSPDFLGIATARQVCVSSWPGLVGFEEPSVAHAGPTDAAGNSLTEYRVPGLTRAGNFNVRALDLCRFRPNLRMRALHGLTFLPNLALIVGFLICMHLLLRSAREHGLFSVEVARRVRFLGWYVVLGSLLVATVQAVARSALLGQIVTGGFRFQTALHQWSVSVGVLVAGVGVITIARVLGRAVALRRDVDATR